jgi:CMP-N-acetylneuraminic acid synthetase
VLVVDRPPHLASSSASTDSVVHHVIDTLQIEHESTVLILQPTSPFRPRSLLEACISTVADNPDCLALTVTRAAKAVGWARCMQGDGRLSAMPSACDPVAPTGAVYAFLCGVFKARGTLESMNKVGVLSDPVHSCDIDEEYELIMAAALAEAGLGDDVIDLRRNIGSEKTL